MRRERIVISLILRPASRISLALHYRSRQRLVARAPSASRENVAGAPRRSGQFLLALQPGTRLAPYEIAHVRVYGLDPQPSLG